MQQIKSDWEFKKNQIKTNSIKIFKIKLNWFQDRFDDTESDFSEAGADFGWTCYDSASALLPAA